MSSPAAADVPEATGAAWPDALVAGIVALPALAAAYRPGSSPAGARREAVLCEGAAVSGAPALASVHRALARLLGSGPEDHLDARLAFTGVSLLEGGRGIDRSLAADLLGERAVGLAEAALAMGAMASRVERSAARLRRRGLAGLRPDRLARTVSDIANVAAAAPVAVPLAIVGAGADLANRVVPARPVVEWGDDEPNLLAHLVGTAVPRYLSHAVVRTVVLRLPRVVGIGVRSGAHGATVRVGRGRVVVSNGVADDVVAVVDGDADVLALAGLGALTRELRGDAF